MQFRFSARLRRAWPHSRAGISHIALGAVAALVVGLPVLAWTVIPSSTFSEESEGPLVHKVTRGPFVHEVVERGDVESSSTVDVRCEVQTQGTGGTAILEIVPEGTRVQKGDILCKLDSSWLENQLNSQQVACNASTAALINAKNVHETALIARQEYLEGIYKQEEQLIQGEIFVAEENLRRAQEYANYSKDLAQRNFITSVTLEGDLFAVEKAKKDLGAAKTKLKVLQDLTKTKMLNTLDAAIKTAEAQLKSQENINRIDLDKLAQIKMQIEKCEIRAPQDGEVTYGNSSDYRDSDAVIIKEGVLIRDRQVIIRLPNPDRMQVNAKVNESKLRLIQKGMPAVIKLESLSGTELIGTVTKIFQYANRSRYSSSTVKEFSVIVEISNPPAELRTGSSAEVRIRVNQSPSELLVPVQAIIESGGKHYCLQSGPGKGWKAVRVELGPTNDSHVVIKSGLTDSDTVVLNPRSHLDEIDLPELKGKEIQAGEMLAGYTPPTGKGEPPAASTDPKGNNQGAPEAAAAEPDIAGMRTRMDRNGDGKITIDDIAENRKASFSTMDTNRDGSLDEKELAAMAKRFAGGGGRGPGGGGAGGPRGGPGPNSAPNGGGDGE